MILRPALARKIAGELTVEMASPANECPAGAKEA